MYKRQDENGWRTKDEYDIRYRFELSVEIHECVPEGFDIGYNDNIIIGCALHLASSGEESVYVITKDINLRVKCDAVGLGVEDYLKDRVEEDVDTLCGWKQIRLEPSDFEQFYNEGKITTDEEVKPNQFIIGKSDSNQSMLGIYKKGCINSLVHKMDGLIKVEPRNAEQSFAIEALMDPTIPLVCLTGLAGSGKTFLALMAG